jgi:glycerol-3-phosphate cytidylyltransferase
MIIGFTCGAFDLLHAGHQYFFNQCKNQCDYLKVGLQFDPSKDRKCKNAPVQSLYERYLQLKSSKFVDEIIPYDDEQDLLNLLKTQKIDIRFIGSDYLDREYAVTGYDLNIKKVYIPRNHTFSSSNIRHKIEKLKDW